ncbi:protein kinase [Lactobacillus ruminis]|nr:protein kinase [Ligilactobacillus ruminis]
MPKAEQYNPQKFSVLQKMEQMFELGNCIRQLHKLGFVHRDIKPKNLLLFDGRLCLSDFGLVRNIADTDEHITEMNEPLGPRAIRPPEFQLVEEIADVDYRKSDVYLYAKTIWMVLNCNKN